MLISYHPSLVKTLIPLDRVYTLILKGTKAVALNGSSIVWGRREMIWIFEGACYGCPSDLERAE